MRTVSNDEGGMITAFAAIFVVALLLFAGLVFDGGMIVVNKRAAIDHAESAARAGAQVLNEDAYRSTSVIELDAGGAQQAAKQYLQRAGERGQVAVVGDRVNVTVERDVPMRILGIGGLMQAHVSGSGAARLEQG